MGDLSTVRDREGLDLKICRMKRWSGKKERNHDNNK